MNDVHSLSHSKWNCKYHIVFAPKYRRKVFYAEKRLEIGEILGTLCDWYGVSVPRCDTYLSQNHSEIGKCDEFIDKCDGV